MNKLLKIWLALWLSLCMTGCVNKPVENKPDISLSNIPEYSGKGYVEINGNVPTFTEEEITTESYKKFSDLDSLGRCGMAEACLGPDLLPTQKRGDIYWIHPTGWHSDKYNFIEGENLYNRSHLLAHSLTGEDANEKNLITGTRYMNADVMEPFEDMTTDYIRETKNHVMYRVTPIFEGDNLLANGVHMQGYSVEDKGDGISFNIYCYNVQPGVVIDYATGDNHLADAPQTSEEKQLYVLNKGSKKFHRPDCEGVKDISKKNYAEMEATRSYLIELGYQPCGSCNP